VYALVSGRPIGMSPITASVLGTGLGATVTGLRHPAR